MILILCCLSELTFGLCFVKSLFEKHTVINTSIPPHFKTLNVFFFSFRYVLSRNSRLLPLWLQRLGEVLDLSRSKTLRTQQ
jgi:hypothetical protein